MQSIQSNHHIHSTHQRWFKLRELLNSYEEMYLKIDDLNRRSPKELYDSVLDSLNITIQQQQIQYAQLYQLLLSEVSDIISLCPICHQTIDLK